MLSNANQARYRFCKLALCKTNIDVKVNKYGYTVFKKSRRKFQDGRSRIKYFAIGNKIYDMKTTLILNHEYKKLPSAKNILGGFSCFVVIVLLPQHRVNRTSNSAGAVIKLPRHVYSRNSEASVSNNAKIRGFCFCSLSFSFNC